MKTLDSFKATTDEECAAKLEECRLGVIANSVLPGKGFDDEEIAEMTKEELKEYGISRRLRTRIRKAGH